MKTAEYKLAGDIPSALRGKTIKTRESETLAQMTELVENGTEDNVRRLAQAQYDIIVQRKIRDAATSEEIEGILAGKTVKVDDEELDFSGMSDDERLEYAVGRLQDVADAYVYGARPLIAGGGSKAAKTALAEKGKIAEAAKNDPELAAKLAALGIAL